LAEKVIPDIVGRRPHRRFEVWSAGCARGEEAATLAIFLAESPDLRGWDWRIVATDVDSEALVEAKDGIFGRRAIARVPAELLTRYFTPVGDRFQLAPELRARIDYRPLNLTAPRKECENHLFDVIFLRNVLIYFRPEVQKKVVAAVGGQLVDDGYLFLGPSESLMFLGSDLHPRDLGSCFCYRHPGPMETVDEPADRLGQAALNSKTPSVPDRMELPTSPSRAATPPNGDDLAIEDRLELVIETLERGDDTATLKLIENLRCRLPESAILHALEGLVLERGGEQDRAVRAYRAALYLDSDFREVRFLLARGLELLGRHDRAAREYRAALAALGSAQEKTPTVFPRLGLPSFSAMADECREALRRLN
jgi:chemotaxis protein methyltransferase CheR